MSSGSRVFCKSFLVPSLASTELIRFKFFRARTSSSNLSRVFRMATEPPSSSSSSPPHSASASSNGDSSSVPASSAIDFLSLCHRLKTTKRTGWVRRDVENPESIADHMYRMGLMALIASDIPGVDRDKCIKMAIVHGIAEAIVGDITPSDGVPKHEKSRREQEALDHMCKLLGGGQRAQEIGQLWMEYEENLSLEAKVVKDFDKAEMILQALEYETDPFQTKFFSISDHPSRSISDEVLLHLRSSISSKAKIWMSFSCQQLGSSRLNWASLGPLKLHQEEKQNVSFLLKIEATLLGDLLLPALLYFFPSFPVESIQCRIVLISNWNML